MSHLKRYAHLFSYLPYSIYIAENTRSLVRLYTNVDLNNSVELALAIVRDDTGDAANVRYNGNAVRFQRVDLTVQWLANGYLAIEGTVGKITIMAGSISFDGGSVNLF